MARSMTSSELWEHVYVGEGHRFLIGRAALLRTHYRQIYVRSVSKSKSGVSEPMLKRAGPFRRTLPTLVTTGDDLCRHGEPPTDSWLLSIRGGWHHWWGGVCASFPRDCWRRIILGLRVAGFSLRPGTRPLRHRSSPAHGSHPHCLPSHLLARSTSISSEFRRRCRIDTPYFISEPTSTVLALNLDAAARTLRL